MWWLFSCFKHDPSKDHLKTAKEISRHQEEDNVARQKIEEEQIEKAKKESLKVAEEEEEKRRLEKSKEKGKEKQVVDDDQVVGKRQIKHSKDHVEENVNHSKCKGCNFVIEDGRFVKAFGALWHPQCLCCLHCREQFAVDEVPGLKRQYHRPCYKKHCNPNCYVCENKIPSTVEGRKFREHPFWKEKYCPSHDDDRTAKCCSCERLEARGTKYVMLDDGRWLCRECLECAVMDTYECHDLHVEIREFFQDLNMKIEKEFSLFLVEKEALNKAEKEEKIDNQYGVVTRGICLSEEHMITSVSKRPKEKYNRLIGMTRESQRVVPECEVTAILILYGLPKFLTGYILAHEMMHAYLRLNGYKNLNTLLEEGLCQMLGHMWLEPHTYATPDVVATAAPTTDSASASSSSSATPPLAATTSKKGDKSEFEKKFVKFCKYQIETDESPVYGDGFREVKNMMVSNNHNLKDTLKQIVSASKSIHTTYSKF